MLVYPSMIANAAKEAGMAVPTQDEMDVYSREGRWSKKQVAVAEKYPHFHVFCNLQLGRPMQMGWDEPSHNAKLIAKLPVKKLKTMKLEDFLKLGLRWSQ